MFGPIALLIITTLIYTRQPQFGQAPAGEGLVMMQPSPHFADGEFENLSITPELTEGYTMSGVMWSQFMDPGPNRTPMNTIPSIKTDLFSLPPDSNMLIWFVRSSYYVQIDGNPPIPCCRITRGMSPWHLSRS